MTPLGSLGSSHWTTTVLELTGLARTLCGALPGTLIYAANTLTIMYANNNNNNHTRNNNIHQQTFHIAKKIYSKNHK